MEAIKVMCSCECCISTKSIHSSLLYWRDRYLKNSNIKSKIPRKEGLVKKHIAYIKQIKIQSCHMDVIFMTKQLIWNNLQCAHIICLIIHFHTWNVYCGPVTTVRVSMFLTNKQIIIIQKQHPQYGLTFITSLDVVLIMVEFHWRTKKCVACVNNNLNHMNWQKCTPEMS